MATLAVDQRRQAPQLPTPAAGMAISTVAHPSRSETHDARRFGGCNPPPFSRASRAIPFRSKQMANDNIRSLNEARQRVWNEANRLLDDVARQKRIMSGVEEQQWTRYNERLDEIDNVIQDLVQRDKRAEVEGATREALERVVGPIGATTVERQQGDSLRRWALGEGPNELRIDLTHPMRVAELRRTGMSVAEAEREARVMNWDTGSLASGVPTKTASELYQLMAASCAMLSLPTTKVMTPDGGGAMKIPRVNAHAIATQVSGQGTTLAGTDPTFLSMTLDAYKYGELVRISNEALQDASFDVAQFLGGNIARAVSRLVSNDLVLGTGSGQPQGVVTAALVGSNGTIPTGGSLITPSYENIVDLVYSVNGSYRASGNAAFLMRDVTAAQVRKLRDGAGGTLGAPLWSPSQVQGIQSGEPGQLLGYPVYTDPAMASCASNAKIAVFGDWSAYFLRQVGPLVIERSADVFFGSDETAFRGKWRVDGDVVDLTALNIMRQNVT
ncbi:MAG: phage major capsid protein [Acidimicrobiales bacterium]